MFKSATLFENLRELSLEARIDLQKNKYTLDFPKHLGRFCEYRSTDDVKQKTENKTTLNKT